MLSDIFQILLFTERAINKEKYQKIEEDKRKKKKKLNSQERYEKDNRLMARCLGNKW